MALQVMRVVQEAITNVVKHADAATITVRTGEAPDVERGPGVFVDVEDDGRGVGPDPAAGRGLAGMRRRAARLGGVVAVEGTGTGTRVRLWLPRGDAGP
jgi:signal transduction histidine kinase